MIQSLKVFPFGRWVTGKGVQDLQMKNSFDLNRVSAAGKVKRVREVCIQHMHRCLSCSLLSAKGKIGKLVLGERRDKERFQ